MRKLLVTAVALAPLAIASGAMAQTEITGERTTPIFTSNPGGNGPDDIFFENGSSITLDEGVAVTIDSDNEVELDAGSEIDMTGSADGSTGILVEGGNTGGLIIGGSILVTDGNEEPEDEDEDGDLDGPLATGRDRYGVRVAGDEPFTGDILVESTGEITADGEDSYAIWIESGLIGDFRSFGNVNAVGTNSAAFNITGNVAGDVFLSGNVSALGEGAVGANIARCGQCRGRRSSRHSASCSAGG